MFSKNKNLFDFYLKVLVFRLLQKNLDTDKIFADKVLEDETTDFSRIRCPLCRWQPTAASRWYCASAGFPEFYPDGCGMVWNTFDTRGKCPGCAHQWRWTTCLACHQHSLHEDWYAKDGE